MFSRLKERRDLCGSIEPERSPSACWSSAQCEHHYARLRCRDVYLAQGTGGNIYLLRGSPTLNNCIGEHELDEPDQDIHRTRSLTKRKWDEYGELRVVADPIGRSH